jgi:hypothetical protein
MGIFLFVRPEQTLTKEKCCGDLRALRYQVGKYLFPSSISSFSFCVRR